MTTTAANMTLPITLTQAGQLILAVPDNRFILLGEPGTGKSSIMAFLSKVLPDHAFGYIDCQCKDLGDVAMPVVNIEERVTYYAPNAGFQLSHNSTRPVCLMLDEFPKAPMPVQNMLHPLLEAHNPRLGDIPLPPGSIIFLTGNLSTDGVGDVLKPHTRNRVTTLIIKKPDADEWLAWAIDNDIDPAVMVWVRDNPHALASYTDGTENENPYIFIPRKMQVAFVSPRSLEKASNIVKRRHMFDSKALLHALGGTIGASAAADMEAHIAYHDELPAWATIIDKPKTTPIPTSPGACVTMIFGAVQKVDRTSINPFMDYVERFDPEWQAMFCIHMARNPTKQQVAFRSEKFKTWAINNADLL